MSGPKASTLAVVGCVSALCFAAAVTFLVHTFSMLPQRVAEAPPPPRVTEPPNPFRTQTPQEVAKQLGFNLREPTPAERQELRELGELRAKMAQRRARDRSITPPHWEQVLADATDLEAFMDEVVPVADGGDTSAQYAVYLALSECRKLMRDPLARTEAQQRCKALSRTGKEMQADAERWLDRSAAGNYPRALAQSAMDRIAEAVSVRMTRAERTQQLRDAEIDLIRALNSDDAAVTWLASQGVSMLYREDPRAQPAMWIWRLAACEQGFPCDEDAPWLPQMCAHFGDCRDGESGREYIRRKSGEFPSLFARARQLATTLSTGKLDAAQFAATVTSIPQKRPREKNTAAVAPP